MTQGTFGYGWLPWCNVGTKIYQSSSITFIIIIIIIKIIFFLSCRIKTIFFVIYSKIQTN